MFKMVNGVPIQMDAAEVNARQADIAANLAAQQVAAAIPDTNTQIANLTAAVVALGGTLPDAQIAVANTTLTVLGRPAITTQTTVKLG